MSRGSTSLVILRWDVSEDDEDRDKQWAESLMAVDSGESVEPDERRDIMPDRWLVGNHSL